jgi:hypothetical protein
MQKTPGGRIIQAGGEMISLLGLTGSLRCFGARPTMLAAAGPLLAHEANQRRVSSSTVRIGL